MNLKKIREQRKLYEAAERAFAKAEALLDRITQVGAKPRDPNWHDKGEIVGVYEKAGDGKMIYRRRMCVESGNPGEWKDVTSCTDQGNLA